MLALLGDYQREALSLRCSQAGLHLVRLCAYLGSPLSEQAAVIGATRDEIIDHAMGTSPLRPIHADRLGSWLMALIWRHGWRRGEQSSTTTGARHDASRHVEALCEVPMDWLRDWSASSQECSAISRGYE